MPEHSAGRQTPGNFGDTSDQPLSALGSGGWHPMSIAIRYSRSNWISFKNLAGET
jgi:hypothetical protein